MQNKTEQQLEKELSTTDYTQLNLWQLKYIVSLDMKETEAYKESLKEIEKINKRYKKSNERRKPKKL